MRLIDTDKLYPDCLTNDGRLAISQSQIANASTIDPDKPLFSEVVFLERSKSEWIERENEKWAAFGMNVVIVV